MILEQSIDVILGKLGNWPGDIDPMTAMELYNLATSLSANSVLVDLMAVGGKSTVILAAAAYRINGRVIAVLGETTRRSIRNEGWNGDHVAQIGMATLSLWFQRAMHLFKMQEIVRVTEAIDTPVDLVVVRDQNQARAVYGEGTLRPGGFVFGLGVYKLDGIQPIKINPAFAVWQRPADGSMR